ncbi:hypothetical protein K431DRAFT_325792 [Polychaeton citri CBS 116435]|uniref:Uncharacterized protein n=1 Tax=Polychaeton citri CBS 116435 TaxID=1314669 RepID=A0A9P4Q126_9PEZI|nr:hypothetical protein K431DRAFT_325792 [Polychaeton citri CBS 116435]
MGIEMWLKIVSFFHLEKGMPNLSSHCFIHLSYVGLSGSDISVADSRALFRLRQKRREIISTAQASDGPSFLVTSRGAHLRERYVRGPQLRLTVPSLFGKATNLSTMCQCVIEVAVLVPHLVATCNALHCKSDRLEL